MTLIIAEAGINHKGSMEVAKDMIKQAKWSGADAIKFQAHIFDKEMADKSRHLSKKLEFSVNDLVELKQACDKNNIVFLCTAFCKEAVDMLDGLVPAYKIGSGELTNYPLLKHIALKGKPMIISTGMATIEEIAASTAFVGAHNNNISIMHCVSEYPPDESRLNLHSIIDLHELGFPVGFSDHTKSLTAPAYAVCCGANAIEKHFMTEPDCIDAGVSISPGMFRRMVENIAEAEESITKTSRPTENELKVASWARHSVTASKLIPAGSTITEDMITTMRPAKGIPAKEYYNVVGMTAQRDLKKNEQLIWSDIV